MSIQDQSGFFLDDWWVSPREGRIARGGEHVRLEPKVMEVLEYFASHPGRVVSREELEREVWRGALVGYDAVTGTVIKLRRALQDDARHPRLIATIPKRGYELIGTVKVADASDLPQASAGPAPQAARAPPAPRPRRAGRRSILIALLTTGVAAVVLATAWLANRPPPTPAVTVQPPSVAVLPFENLSEAPENDHLADGMTEDIITDLSRSARLLVIASNSSFTYKDRKVTPKEVARELDVVFVLLGNIRPVGTDIRINVQLVDATSGFNKWAARYDRKREDLFAVQDEITSGIITALEVPLTREEQQRLARRATANLRAYDLFQEGQAASKVQTKEALERAGDAYRRAIQADPGYGRAYGALGYTLATAFRRGWSDAPMETSDHALEMAKKGVALDDSIPQTHWSLGYVYLFRGEYENAERAAAQSIAIAPNYADGYGLLALINNNLGRPERAIEFITKGMRLNPYYTWDYPFNLGWAHYTQGRYGQAVEQLELAHQRNPNAIPVKLFLAASYVGAGRQDDAEWLAAEIQALSETETIGHTEKTIPMANPEHKRALLEDLRRAGLPE